MLQYWILNTTILTAKLSPYYFTYLLFNLRFKIEEEQDLLQTIRSFISERDGRCDWLQTTTEHDVVWSSWAGDHGELFCAHLNGEWKFHTKSHEQIGAFFARPPDWARCPPLLRAERSLPLPGCWTIVPVLRILFSRLSMLSSFQPWTVVGKFMQQPSCTIPLWQTEISNKNPIFLWNFQSNIRSRQFPKIK